MFEHSDIWSILAENCNISFRESNNKQIYKKKQKEEFNDLSFSVVIFQHT